MFHIKKDKRSQTSAILILEAMDVCLRRHPFEDVSITEVCNQATISRATFYRLFDTLEDVIAYAGMPDRKIRLDGLAACAVCDKGSRYGNQRSYGYQKEGSGEQFSVVR